ncbi:hypothetical protein SAMD00023353_0801170 [Rosellinia necatrix]|uniref:Uncharacterized protein n=1 Tax=Rosellinia necatrix TaxID=77044 RepID=A0A1W2TAZ4_ROSNE|nr:hypothetical protein SAMD00023353_0801170 [Rosellinia necatrix]
MASINPPASPGPLLTVPLEIRRMIYGYCLPQGQTFDCSDDMAAQNRPLGWSPRYADEIDEEYPSGSSSSSSSSEDGGGNYNEEDKREGEGEGKISADERRHHNNHHNNHHHYRWPLPTTKSALPALLLVCHQITDEAETMLYAGNVFTVDAAAGAGVGAGVGAYDVAASLPFAPRNQRRIRNVILELRPATTGMANPRRGGSSSSSSRCHGRPNAPSSSSPSSSPPLPLLLDPGVWDPIIGNLATLGVIVGQPEDSVFDFLYGSVPGDCSCSCGGGGGDGDGDGGEGGGSGSGSGSGTDARDFLTLFRDRKREVAAEWATWLLPLFEYLLGAVRGRTEIVVDVAGQQEEAVRALDFFRHGPFRFRKLPVAR